MTRHYKFVVVLFSILVSMGCDPELVVTSAEGMRPIYASGDELNIALEEPQSYEILNQIVYAEPFILIGELYQGIHIVDNTDPAFPEKLHFIRIPGCSSFTVGDGVLYATSGSDLVTVTFDGETVTEQNRIASYFSGSDSFDQNAPANYSGFFECVDPSKGVVIGWTDTVLENPQCRTQ